jgi:hypothetical protein
MSPAEVLKHLQRIRFSPRAGRPVAISWIARQGGYTHVGLFRAIRLGSITPAMARRLSPILARVQLSVVNKSQGDIAPTLGPLAGGTVRLGRGSRRRPEPETPARPGAPSRQPKVETLDD